MKTLGRYVLQSPLGSGGMGTVWAAELVGARGFRKPVAVKVLDGQLEGDHAAQLIDEARIGAMISHPNVVASFDLGVVEGTWYIAMERVDGPSANALLKEGPVGAAAVLDLGAQTARGLAYLHGLPGQLVHGDIKPHNLLVDRSGLVRIVDFGVASVLGTKSGLQGTPNYMAPEHVSDGAVPASDIFSLGVTLYRLLTGERLLGDSPYTRRAMVMRGLAGDDAVWARVDRLAPGLGDLLRRVMAPQHEDRPDAETLSVAFQQLALSAEGVSLAECVAQTEPVVSAPEKPLGSPLIGRRKAMKELSEHVQRRGVFLVTGPAGSGKSRLAHEVLPHAPCLELAGVRTLEELDRRLGALLEVELQEDASPTWWAKRLPPVLVLNDADGLAHLLPRFLEVADAHTLVVTSRVRMRASATVELGPLQLEDAVALFKHLLPDPLQGGDLVPLVEALDCLPLALELIAAHGDTQSPAAMLANLGEGGPLHAALELSWGLLDQAERDTLVAMAAFRGTAALEDLQAVGGPAVFSGLAGLLQHNLVQANGERVELLSAVREFARERGEVPLEAHARRFAQRGSVEALEALRRTGGPRRFQALMVDAENLDAALEHALREVPELVAPLALARIKVFERRGPLEAVIRLARQVVPTLTGVERVALEERWAWCLERVGRLEDALELSHRAGMRAPTAALKSDCLRREGICWFKLGDADQAAELTQQALELALEAGDAFRVGEIHLNAGIIASGRSQPEVRAAHDRAALKFATTHGHHALAGMVLGNLAREQLLHGAYAKAVRLQEQSLEAFETCGHRLARLHATAVIGAMKLELGELDEARTRYADVVATAERTGQGDAVAHYSTSLAEVEIWSGRLDAADDRLLQAEAIERRSATEIVRAMWHRRRGEPELALELLAHLTELQHSPQAYTHVASARCLLDLGRVEDAAHEAEQGVRQFRDLRRPAQLAYALAVLALVRQARGDDPASLVLKSRELADKLGLQARSPVRQVLADLE